MTLLLKAIAAGLKVSKEGNTLVVRGPRKAHRLATDLLAHKMSVMDALATLPQRLPTDWHFLWDERAAIKEYDGGLAREQAEAEALNEVLHLMNSKRLLEIA